MSHHQSPSEIVNPVRDPEEIEPQHLEEIGILKDAHVLEIGSGDGRLTWRYANWARSVVALDPDWERIAAAASAMPRAYRSKISLIQARSEALPLRRGAFDVVLLAWSL